MNYHFFSARDIISTLIKLSSISRSTNLFIGSIPAFVGFWSTINENVESESVINTFSIWIGISCFKPSISTSPRIPTSNQSLITAVVWVPTLSEYTFLASTVKVTSYVPSSFSLALACFALFSYSVIFSKASLTKYCKSSGVLSLIVSTKVPILA